MKAVVQMVTAFFDGKKCPIRLPKRSLVTLMPSLQPYYGDWKFVLFTHGGFPHIYWVHERDIIRFYFDFEDEEFDI
jgi:hypothetical protein